MKKQKYLTRVIAGILSALMCMMLLNMPVYADTYELYQATPGEMVESEVPLNFIDEVELQEAGWYKQKVGDGSATFDKFVIDAIVAVLTSKAPGIKKAAAEAIANYILNNHLQGSYYTKYLNSQVVDVHKITIIPMIGIPIQAVRIILEPQIRVSRRLICAEDKSVFIK